MKKAKGSNLFDPAIQLEELPAELETPYQRIVAFLGRCLLPAVALVFAMTIFEGATGALSSLSGRAWLAVLARVPSAIGGQGNLSASAIAAMVRARGEKEAINVLITGDSVFAPNLGGGTTNEMQPDQVIDRYIPGSLNVSQEGGEWGMNALLIRRLAAEPVIQQQKPLLVVDVNFKFFGMTGSFSPAFPIELELCSRPTRPLDQDFQILCDQLSADWPPALRTLGSASGFLVSGVLGQMDFVLSFLQRGPLYEYNVRGWGRHPFRTFKPGILDAKHVSEGFTRNPPTPWHFDYSSMGASTERYLGTIHRNFTRSTHPKHHWMRMLARATSEWPGRVLVIWVHPSPDAEAVVAQETCDRMNEMKGRAFDIFNAVGKQDLEIISTRDHLNESRDYFDSDHPSSGGHRKLGEVIRAKLEKR